MTAHFLAITPSDTANLPAACSSFSIGAAGAMQVTAQGDPDSAAVTLTVPMGIITLPYPVQKIWATGTTATGIICLGL